MTYTRDAELHMKGPGETFAKSLRVLLQRRSFVDSKLVLVDCERVGVISGALALSGMGRNELGEPRKCHRKQCNVFLGPRSHRAFIDLVQNGTISAQRLRQRKSPSGGCRRLPWRTSWMLHHSKSLQR